MKGADDMLSSVKDKYFQLAAKRSIKKFGREKIADLALPGKPMNEWRVSFLTTAGIHLAEEPPFDVEAGDWSVRYIPADTAAGQLTVSHTHYDTKAAKEDVNTVFPIETMRKLEKQRVIGAITPTLFGMMGYIPRTDKLIKKSVPVILKRLKEEKADVLLLSPG